MEQRVTEDRSIVCDNFVRNLYIVIVRSSFEFEHIQSNRNAAVLYEAPDDAESSRARDIGRAAGCSTRESSISVLTIFQ